jgi:hypothetical protein
MPLGHVRPCVEREVRAAILTSTSARRLAR